VLPEREEIQINTLCLRGIMHTLSEADEQGPLLDAFSRRHSATKRVLRWFQPGLMAKIFNSAPSGIKKNF
jgi:hypothetical protein